MGTRVLITGAGTGLGLETALYLAARGWRVYASIPDPAQRPHIDEQMAARQVVLHIVQLDVTDEASIAAAVATMIDDCGGIDAVINNAGVSLRGYFEDTDDDEVRRTIEINLFGSLNVTRAVLPHMRAAGSGRIIFMSSIGGRIASMARTAYCASKFGIEGFAEALSQEVAPFGILVSIIEPAIIKTERWTVHRGLSRRALDAHSPYVRWFEREEEMADRLLQSSPTVPTDVAVAVHAALTLPRPRLRYIVGRRANLVVQLRRHLPGELFERLYFGEAIRRVTGIRPPL